MSKRNISISEQINMDENYVPKLTTKNVVGLFAMIFGLFLSLLDQEIVASSLGEIQAGLGASDDEISGIQTWYILAQTVVLPLCGWISRVVGTHVFFSLCAVGFAFTSYLCGISWSLESMLLFRILQGICAGGMIPSVYAALYRYFPKQVPVLYATILAFIITLGPTAGPILGGHITQALGWEWIFYINIIPGMLIALLVYSYARMDEADYSLLKGFDYPGIFFVIMFLGCTVYALEHGAKNNWFDSNLISGLLIAGVVFGILTFWRELTCKNPVLQLNVFRHKRFAIGCVLAFCDIGAMMASLYLIPIFCSHVLGYNSGEVGSLMGIRGLTQICFAPVVAILITQFDIRKLCGFGLCMVAVTMLLFADLSVDSGRSDFTWMLILGGIGFLCGVTTTNMIALDGLPKKDIKGATSLYAVSGSLGGTYFLAFVNTLVVNRSVFHYSNAYGIVNPENTMGDQFRLGLIDKFTTMMPGIEGAEQAAVSFYYAQVQKAAFAQALKDGSMIIAGALLFAACLLFFIPKVKSSRKIELSLH